MTNKLIIKSIILSILVGIFIFSCLHSVNASLPSVMIGKCINLFVQSNCSSVNLTQVTYNGDNPITYNINGVMTKNGQTFNYTFCNINYPGVHIFSWNPPCEDCSDGHCGNSFDATVDCHPYSNFPIEYFIAIIAIVFLILNRYLSKLFETKDLFNLLAGMLFIIDGILTLYPGFNYFNYTNIQGFGIGLIFIGIGSILITKQMENFQ